MMNNGALVNRSVAPRQLTSRQQELFDAINRYYSATGEPCPSRFLARRFGRHHKTIQEHRAALERKGWLRGPGVPRHFGG